MKTYSVWGESIKEPNTLFEGTTSPKFVNGDLQPDCPVFICSFQANCLETANDKYKKIIEFHYSNTFYIYCSQCPHLIEHFVYAENNKCCLFNKIMPRDEMGDTERLDECKEVFVDY